jgi:catalase
MKEKHRKLTTASGKPYTEHENTMTVGQRGLINGERKDEIINRQLCHFFRADVNLGIAVAKGLGVKIDPKLLGHTSELEPA